MAVITLRQLLQEKAYETCLIDIRQGPSYLHDTHQPSVQLQTAKPAYAVHAVTHSCWCSAGTALPALCHSSGHLPPCIRPSSDTLQPRCNRPGPVPTPQPILRLLNTAGLSWSPGTAGKGAYASQYLSVSVLLQLLDTAGLSRSPGTAGKGIYASQYLSVSVMLQLLHTAGLSWSLWAAGKGEYASCSLSVCVSIHLCPRVLSSARL